MFLTYLFKNIKQVIINNTVITISDNIIRENNLTSNIVDYKHIEEPCKHQNGFELKLFHKLNIDDIQKSNPFDKMKVSKATSFINMDVAASLFYLVENEDYHSSYKTTAWFIRQVSKWFTLMSF